MGHTPSQPCQSSRPVPVSVHQSTFVRGKVELVHTTRDELHTLRDSDTGEVRFFTRAEDLREAAAKILNDAPPANRYEGIMASNTSAAYSFAQYRGLHCIVFGDGNAQCFPTREARLEYFVHRTRDY